MEPTGEKGKKIVEFLTRQGYIPRNDFYTSMELTAVLDLHTTLQSDPQMQDLLRRTTKIQRTVKIKEGFDPNDQKDLLARLFDFSGDKKLTAKNAKKYSKNVLFAAFQRVLGLGKDTQLNIATELAMYQKLSGTIDTAEKLVTMIASITGRDRNDVAIAMQDEQKFKALTKEFQRSFLTQVARTTPEIASEIDPTKAQKYQVEKAKEQQEAIKKIKEKLQQEGFVDRVRGVFGDAKLPNPDATTINELMDRTALRIYSINPQPFMAVGTNTSITKTTTHITDITHTLINDIHIVQNAAGQEISRTETTRDGGTTQSTRTEKKSESKTTPSLVIGFHQDIFGAVGERWNVNAGAGASMVARPEGVVFPITLSTSSDLTVLDNNTNIQTSDLKGNFVL